MTIVFKSVFILFVSTFLAACTTENNTEAIYKSLKDGQAKITVRIDGEPFYTDKSVFTGSLDLTERFFKMNMFDQFESNVIVGFGEPNWYVKHPIERKVFAENQMQASVMVGKMVDRVNRYGTGFLMTDGILSIRALSEEKVIIHFQGKMGKYATMREPEKWSMAEGDIIYKKPKINISNINKASVYF